MKSLWIILHSHRYGITYYHLRADKEPTEEQVIELFDIDLETDRGEEIEIELIEEADIKEI